MDAIFGIPVSMFSGGKNSPLSSKTVYNNKLNFQKCSSSFRTYLEKGDVEVSLKVYIVKQWFNGTVICGNWNYRWKTLNFPVNFFNGLHTVHWLADRVRAPMVPLNLGLIHGPFVPYNLISAQESSVPLPKFRKAPRLKILMYSISKKRTQIYSYEITNRCSYMQSILFHC